MFRPGRDNSITDKIKEIYDARDALWSEANPDIPSNPQTLINPENLARFLIQIAQRIYPTSLEDFFATDSIHFASGRFLAAKTASQPGFLPEILAKNILENRGALWAKAAKAAKANPPNPLEIHALAFVDEIAKTIFPIKLSKLFSSNFAREHFQSGRLVVAKQIFVAENPDAADLFFARDKLWDLTVAATGDASRTSGENIAEFTRLIREFIKPVELETLLQDRNFQSGRLSYVKQHCHTHPATSTEPGSLADIANQLVKARETVWNNAIRNVNGDSLRDVFIAFYKEVNKFLAERSKYRLNDLIADEAARTILQRSGRLNILVTIYLDAKAEAKPKPSIEIPTDVRELLQRAQAKGQGIETELGIPKGQTPEALKQEAKELMLQEHPDKNPEGDRERAEGAIALFKLVKAGHFDEYLALLDKARPAADSAPSPSPVPRGKH